MIASKNFAALIILAVLLIPAGEAFADVQATEPSPDQNQPPGLPSSVTTQSFSVPAVLKIMAGDTAISADGRTRITVDKMVVNTTKSKRGYNAVDITVQLGDKTQQTVLKPGEAYILGDLKLNFIGNFTGTKLDKSYSNSAFKISGVHFDKEKDVKTMSINAGNDNSESHQTQLIIPAGETFTSTDGHYQIKVNKLAGDPNSFVSVFYNAEVTVEAGGQKEHAILEMGNDFTVNGLTFHYVGYSGANNVVRNVFTLNHASQNGASSSVLNASSIVPNKAPEINTSEVKAPKVKTPSAIFSNTTPAAGTAFQIPGKLSLPPNQRATATTDQMQVTITRGEQGCGKMDIEDGITPLATSNLAEGDVMIAMSHSDLKVICALNATNPAASYVIFNFPK